MNENLKTIEDLLDFKFKIEAYQRGYRWDMAQVHSLLADINEFTPEYQSFYCLQPLVVKQIDKKTFELIDGQQRITTICLILSYLNYKTYQLFYTTRGDENGVNKFFEKLPSLEMPEELPCIDLDNFIAFDNYVSKLWKESITKNDSVSNTVDNFYLYRAYCVIKSWFSELNEKEKEQFCQKLLTQTKVIWYVENIDSTDKRIIKKFIDFNEGKIELEQAELIKALFVLDLKRIPNVIQRQYEENQFADEWNQIEHQMSEDKFWQFVSNNKNDKNTANKINLLFQLYNDFGPQEDHFYNYRKLEKEFKKNKKNNTVSYETTWQAITSLYNGLEEWYFDRASYHLVGAIIHLTNENISTVLDDAKEADNKNQFRNLLRNRIQSFFKNDDGWKEKFNPETIKYNDIGVFKLLLLYNIALTQVDEVDSFFPFYRFYNVSNWNIEHILAQNDDGLNSFFEFQNYYLDIVGLIKKINENEISQGNKDFISKLCGELNDLIENKKKADCKKKINEINEKLNEFLSVDDFNNLCLLDQVTNIKVGKKPFRQKRNIILKMDTNIKINRNSYIPIGTQYVFSKNTTSSENFQIDYWSQKDKECYQKKVEKTINQFLKHE